MYTLQRSHSDILGLYLHYAGFPANIGGTCTPEQTCSGQCPWTEGNSGRPPLCFCDQDCPFFNDCCKDHTQCSRYRTHVSAIHSQTPSITSTNVTYSCVRVRNFVDKKEWQIISAGRPVEKLQYGYYIIASCPTKMSSDTDRNYRKMCEDENRDVILNTPVYDHQGLTYKNMFCALCNGLSIQNIKSWNVEFSKCNSSFNSTGLWTVNSEIGTSGTFTKWVSLATKYCDVTVTEPAKAKPLRRCFPNLVSNCPSSFFDQRIRTLCRRYQSVIAANGIYYRNKYCAQCNLGVEVRCNIVRYDPPQIRFYSLRIVADFSKGDYYVINHEGERSLGFPPCPNQDQIFDIFLEKCRVVNCAKGYLTPFGDCIKIPSTIPTSCGPFRNTKSVRIETQISNKFDFRSNECSDMIDWWLTCVSEVQRVRLSFTLNDLVGECSVDNIYKIANMSITTTNSSDPRVSTSLLGLINTFKSQLEIQSLPCQTLNVDFQQGCLSLHRDLIGAGKCRDVTMNSSRSVEFNVTENQTSVPTNLNVSYQAKILQNLIYVTSFTETGTQVHTRQRVMACNRLALDHVPCPVDSAPYSDFIVVPVKNGRERLKYLPTEKIIKANQYEITANGTVLVCHGVLGNTSASISEERIPIFSFSSAEILVSCFGLGLSLISMLITFTTYLVFPSMRNLPGKTVMSLIVALFVGQGLFLFGVGETQNDTICTVIAIILHYAWLSAFTWTNVLAFHLSQSLGTRAGSMRKRFVMGSKIYKTFLLYCAYGWGAPLVVVLVSVAVDFWSNADFQYGTIASCWITGGLANLLAFGVPVGLTLLVNVAMFTNIVSGFLSRRTPRSGLEDERRRRRKTRRDTMVSFKIALLMGFTWLFAYIAAWAAITVLWYVFILLNSLQGVYILTAFTCNRGTCKLWSTKVNRFRERCSKMVTRTTNNSSGHHRCIREDGSRDELSGDICQGEEAMEECKLKLKCNEDAEPDADIDGAPELSITPV
ncbi:adhesion G-protein coupled receptor G6-like [Lytechinus variegatus]|uniref:adhesion G-protein coupled receptor G6-like n=1 Tax=Lytechinus variegatus TaxID=7654 RepID=UPI001BB241F9|nr:adhesion G-protein coupled receptor G6-like [Lytechinus variegatus]